MSYTAYHEPVNANKKLHTRTTVDGSDTVHQQYVVDSDSSDFKRLLKFEPMAGEEIRRDEQTTDDYHGAAPDGTLTSAASWKVCRFYKDASNNITRVRYRTGVVWDNRTAGW